MMSVTRGYDSFFCSCTRKAHHVESALLQVADVAPQLFVVHLAVLFYFLFEVRRRLREVREGGDVERAVVGDR